MTPSCYQPRPLAVTELTTKLDLFLAILGASRLFILASVAKNLILMMLTNWTMSCQPGLPRALHSQCVKPLELTKSFVKSQNSTAANSAENFTWHSYIVKSVFLTDTKFRSAMTRHCSVVTELKCAILQWTKKDSVTIFTWMCEHHLRQCLGE